MLSLSLALALASSGAAAAPQAEAAAEPSLEELLRIELPRSRGELGVSTAGRLAQSADLAPAVTHVLTRQEIERLGLRRFTDVLRRLPGFHARDGQEFARVSVRGIGPGDFNGRVLFLLDGMRLNENIYDAGQIDLDFVLDVSLIERVEFIPGPGSALYGSNALLGVVNVVTQRADRWAGPQVQVGVGKGGERQGRLSLGQRLEDGSEWLMAFSFARDPQLPQLISSLQPFEDDTRPYDWDDARRALLSWRSGGLQLRALGVSRVRGLPGYVEPLDAFRQSRDDTRIQIANGSWQGRLGSAWDVEAALTLQQLRYRRDDPFFESEAVGVVTDRFEALGRWAIVEARAGREWAENHYLLTGLEWQRDALQRFRYEIYGFDRVDENHQGRRLGLFLQDEWRLGERQRLVLGLRADRQAQRPWRLSPRLSWAWSPQPGHSLKLIWGEALRVPNRFEVETNVFMEQPAPGDERSAAFELAYERPLGDTWRLRWSLYRMALRRPIEADAEGAYRNGSGERVLGTDLGLEARGKSGWELQLAASLLQPRRADGSRSALVPTAQLKWMLSLPLHAQWRLAWHGWAQSRRHGDEASGGSLPGYAVGQVHLLWQADAHWQLFAGVQNAGGRRWLEPRFSGEARAPFAHRGEHWQLGATWRP